MAMLNDPVPRIVADTANAIVNFLDEADGPSMAPYLDELVTKLLLVLQHSHLKFVNEEVCLPRLPKSSICSGNQNHHTAILCTGFVSLGCQAALVPEGTSNIL